jgi:hypothetical protein
MLGDNGDNSYVVGFGKSYPRYVQSMGASCPGTPTHPIVRLVPSLRLTLHHTKNQTKLGPIRSHKSACSAY